MHLAECVQRRHPAFTNHTPREFEMTACSTGSSRTVSEMPADSPMSPGTRSPTSIIPPSTWSVEKGELDQTIIKQDPIRVEEAESGTDHSLRPDTWSMQYACTDQAPYNPDQLTANTDSNMMTATSLLKLPRDNASHDLAFFLRTTGPELPDRLPTKVEPTKPPVTAPMKPWWFFRFGSKRSAHMPKEDRESLDVILRDEGRLLSDGPVPMATMPMGAEQKFSSTGKGYMALQIPTATDSEAEPSAAAAKAGDVSPCLEPQVSISVFHEVNATEHLDSWLHVLSKENLTNEVPAKRALPTRPSEDSTLRTVQHSLFPSRPAASIPPSPAKFSEASRAASFDFDLELGPSFRQSYDATRALSSHPVVRTSSSLAEASIALPNEAFPVRCPGGDKSVDIKAPCPRRMGSHPLLLQRASSFATILYPPNPSDSPGPPPPRSPIRLRRDSRSIGNIMAAQGRGQAPAPKTAPVILPGGGSSSNKSQIKPTVTTDCSGPISRKKSPDSGKTRAKKLREKPSSGRKTDTTVSLPQASVRQRLKKARPQVQHPQLRPAPLVTRRSSSALNASFNCPKTKSQSIHPPPTSPVPSDDDEGWMIDRYTTPVSAVPSQNSGHEKTGYTPNSPGGCNASHHGMALSPVMLIAEQVPIISCRTPPARPAKVVHKDSRGYTPRPRSASIYRTALNRRSRTGQPSSRPVTPTSVGDKSVKSDDDPPPLPSPPPNRALPPTPPVSASRKPTRTQLHAATAAAIAAAAAAAEAEDKSLPDLPITANSKAMRKTSIRRSEPTPHILTQQKPTVQILRTPSASDPHASTPDGDGGGSSSRTSRFDARLEALEKQNALLSAALMAVLKTNGALNGPPAEEPAPPRPAQWEGRIARKTAVARAHATSGSKGSALDMYMSTRRAK